MKKSILSMAVIVTMVFTMFIGCQTPSKKIDNAQENVLKANEELNQALKDSIQIYRSMTQQKLIANEKRIADYKAKIAIEKKESKDKHEMELAKLVQKNNDLKTKLENYTEEDNVKWEAFKIEFNRDMDELGQALKDLSVKNVK
jgi:exonuclease VII large subunit